MSNLTVYGWTDPVLGIDCCLGHMTKDQYVGSAGKRIAEVKQ